MIEAAGHEEVAGEPQTRRRIALRRREKVESKAVSIPDLPTHGMKGPRAAQNREEGSVVEALRELESAVISLAHFRGGIAFRRHQRGTEHRQQIQLLFQPGVGFGKAATQRERAT